MFVLSIQIAYIVFLIIFSYSILVRMDTSPTWIEMYAIAYILSLGCEKVREIITSEPVVLSHKFSVWAWNMWNPCDAAAIIFFTIGLSLRLRRATFDVGRVIYCVDCMYWYLRMLNILGVNKYLGTYGFAGRVPRDLQTWTKSLDDVTLLLQVPSSP